MKHVFQPCAPVTVGLLATVLAACSHNECESQSDPVATNNCYLARAVESYDRDHDEYRQIVSSISDADSRDLLRVRLLVDVPGRADDLCPDMETPSGETTCETLWAKPHISNPDAGRR